MSAAPQRLTPSLRERVWGRTRLEPWFPDSPRPIGEAWYLAAHDLPLLVKMIFTSERLSVQVHPDDGEDGPRGKTEMWHIVEADPGATIALGFREPITRSRLVESAKSGEIERLLNWVDVRPGQTFFVPAHTVHAIGAGIVLFEIQQNSDVTYRLWDYGRARELHLERAAPIADTGKHPGAVHGAVTSKHFVTEMVAERAWRAEPRECQLLICIEGSGRIGPALIRAGEVWLLPDEPVAVECRGRFLRTFVPPAPSLALIGRRPALY